MEQRTTPQEFKQQQLALAELLDELPEGVRILSVRADNYRTRYGAYNDVLLGDGIEAAADAFGAEVASNEIHHWPFKPMQELHFNVRDTCFLELQTMEEDK